jgi:hypothetical protein
MGSRHLASFLLSLALLFGQLGSFAHAASHLTESDKERPHTVCELCVAYAAFDAAATPTALPSHADGAYPTPHDGVSPSAGIVSVPPYFSHAPPYPV